MVFRDGLDVVNTDYHIIICFHNQNVVSYTIIYISSINHGFTAQWIAQYCLKTVFDDEDNLSVSPYNTSFVRDAMCQYFSVSFSFIFEYTE